MAYGQGGTTTGYNTHVAGTGGYCKITLESETPITGRIKWKQPILTANTGNPEMWIQNVSDEKQGGAYRAFDGQDTTWCTDNSTTSASLLLRIKQPIYINSISVQAFKNEWGETKTVQLYKDSTTVSANNLGSKTFNHNVSDTQVWEFSEPIYTDTILVMVTGQNWCAIKEITIDADMDIDTQIKEINEFKLPSETLENVINISNWTQPTLTANGTLGGDSFAINATSSSSTYPPYYGYNKQTSSWITQTALGTAYTMFYNPNALNVTLLTVTNPNGHSHAYPITEGTIMASDDNDTWVELTKFTNSVLNNGQTWNIDLSSNKNYYHYYKLIITKGYGDWWGFDELTITATQKKIIDKQIKYYGII